jgi:hypothetical protein
MVFISIQIQQGCFNDIVVGIGSFESCMSAFKSCGGSVVNINMEK